MPHLAIHGGEPIRHPRKSWPSWPPAEVMDRAVELVTDASVWEDIPCAVFRKALAAETGLPVNTTYEPLNKSPFYIPQSKKRYHIDEAYWKALDPSQYDLPVCTRAYENEAVVIPHAFLLANPENIELVSDAVEKVYQYRDELKDVA